MKLIWYLDTIGPLIPLPFLFFKKGRAEGENIILLYLLIQLALNCAAKKVMISGGNNIHIYQVNAFLSFAAAGMFFLMIFKTTIQERLYNVLFIYYPLNLIALSFIIYIEDVTF